MNIAITPLVQQLAIRLVTHEIRATHATTFRSLREKMQRLEGRGVKREVLEGLFSQANVGTVLVVDNLQTVRQFGDPALQWLADGFRNDSPRFVNIQTALEEQARRIGIPAGQVSDLAFVLYGRLTAEHPRPIREPCTV